MKASKIYGYGNEPTDTSSIFYRVKEIFNKNIDKAVPNNAPENDGGDNYNNDWYGHVPDESEVPLSPLNNKILMEFYSADGAEEKDDIKELGNIDLPPEDFG